MPKGPPPDPVRPLRDAATALNMLFLAVHCVGIVHELFTRRIGSMGREYPSGIMTVGGILLAPALAASLVPPTYGGELLMPYFNLLIALVLVHGLAKRFRKGHVHRHYIGTPWFGRSGEWALGFALAFVAFLACDTLGALHLMSMICSGLSQLHMAARDRRITDHMKDSMYEAEYYSNRLE